MQAEIRRRIAERVWRPGDLIPGEAELAAEFGCARATVNRALQGLAESGLLERRRKAGTRVALDPVRKATLEIPVTRLEVEASGCRYGFHILERRKLRAPVEGADLMGLARNASLLFMRGLHTADGTPFLYEARWVNLVAVPEFAKEDFREMSPNEWLVRNQPFTRGKISFLAVPASPEQADALKAEEGTALFAIERTTWNAETAVTHVRLAYRPGYRMSTEI
ncbi:GntR family transcriptional regulator [Nisaea acidiphila]|uniref:GntR family transcriptional regulator n=1 Tax=Nisaea acidiphila TaxID=1862145 RepID=A0A9J7B1C1_9PROT|nr:GntR family transcriptional regulator [Nisaea acidiphila]UUX52244.1 GntR family transcriptional regulator [Nisaea acidiphila]